MTARIPFFLRALTVLLIATFPTLVHAATLNVPSASYPTIQAGVNASHDGDTVLVADGTYSGTGNRDIDFNGKNITVTSQNGPTKTIIDCGGSASTDGSGNHRGFYIHSGETNATISGFTVKNGYETYNPNIPDSGNGGGVYLSNSGSGIFTLTNCTFSKNTVTSGGPAGFGGAVYNWNDNGGTISLSNCTISNNMAIDGSYGSGDAGEGGAVYNYNNNGGTISLNNCTMSNNMAIADSYGSGGIGGAVYNYNLSDDGIITLTNCIITNNSGYTGGGVLNLNSDPNNFASSITLTNCTITNNTATNYGGGVENGNLYSGSIILTKCTITKNTAYAGGGVSNGNEDGSITLTSCSITNNTAISYGGGVDNENDYFSGSITLTNCSITNNTASYGGGFYIYNYGGTIADATRTITNNTASNGSEVENTNPNSSITLTSCIIANNIASYGGGVYNFNNNFDYSITLTDCTITNNAASYGGGVENINETTSGSIILTNCTITNNTTPSGGGIVYNYNYDYRGSIILTNCICYGDTGDEIIDGAPSTSNTILTYSDIQGGYAGMGNIAADPQFLNAAYGDVHLKPGSPCVGKGTSTGAPTTDKDGNLRPNPPTIGAYEGVKSGVTLQRPSGTLTLYEARFDASHVDLSDKSLITPFDSSGNPLPPIDIPKMASDTQMCTGAVADGATKVLLRYNASTAGTVTFTRLFGVGDDNLRQITSLNAPTGVATQVINGQNVAFALYTVPESLDSTPEAQAAPNHFTQHPVSFLAVFTPTGGAAIPAVSTTLTLESPPVLLIHGFASNPSAWHKDIGTWADLRAAGYPNYAIGIVNYADSANDALASNQLVPLLNTGGILTDIYPAYRAHGIAVTKVDVVAHSKGGVVAREFAAWHSYPSKWNFYKGYVRRLITLGTPHLGTPLATEVAKIANFGKSGQLFKFLISKLPWHYGDVYIDLQPGSTALQQLGTTLIPCYAEVGNSIYGTSSYGNSLLDPESLFNLLPLWEKGATNIAIFQGAANDNIIPVSSAEDNLPSNRYTINYFTNHDQLTTSGTIGAEVVRLLSGPVSDLDVGFSAPNVSSHAVSAQIAPRDLTETAPFVTIASPTLGQTFHSGDTLTINVTPNPGKTVIHVVIEAGTEQITVGSTLLSQAPLTTSFTIPATFVGDLPITVTAVDDANNICVVNGDVLVQTNATLNTMTISASAMTPFGSALLTSQGSNNPLTVTGTFSDSVSRDITAAALGTTYSSSDPTIATVSADGVLTAVANGNCTITVTNGSVTTTENVIVQLGTPNVLSLSPATAYPGNTVSLTLTGTDFGGASTLQFLLNGVPDPNITVTGIQTNTTGTSLTATVTIKAGAASGLRTVVVTTPGGTSDTLAASDAAGFTVMPLSSTHILWDNSNGAVSLWNYSPVNGSFTQNTFGPYPGWTAKAIADGSDGLTRVLWNNTNGQVSLWSLNNTSGAFTQHTFGPYTGWTANALSVGADGTTHILWNNTNGAASVWNYSTTSGSFTSAIYGPFAGGWTAKAIADGSDGQPRILWSNTNGQVSLWSLNSTSGVFTQHTVGPYSGWSANALSVGSDGTTHILWNNVNGAAALWNYSTASGSFTSQTYGPFAGWTAKSISDGSDGKTRLLWDNSNGTMSLWSLDNTTGIFSQYSFGPYAGWTAVSDAGF